MWPAPRGSAPGEWVEVAPPLAVCSRGVHVCRPPDLAHWLHDELWEIETAGERLEALDCVVVERARLVRRIAAWNGPGAVSFAGACIEHGADLVASDATGTSTDAAVHGFLDEAKLAAQDGYPAVAAYCAASAVSRLVPADPAGGREQAYRRERAWQAGWIARQLLGAGGQAFD